MFGLSKIVARIGETLKRRSTFKADKIMTGRAALTTIMSFIFFDYGYSHDEANDAAAEYVNTLPDAAVFKFLAKRQMRFNTAYHFWENAY